MNTASEVEDKDFSLLKPLWLRDLGKNERWLEDAIFKNPSILGLGDLRPYQRQRRQPSGGRLDLLLGNEAERYEVELQLGTTDESHIFRTIEYWDVEERLYPNYKHTAVLVAEEISNRFFNVIYRFSHNIPIVAIDATAYIINDSLYLSFTKVLDTRDHFAITKKHKNTPTYDRCYWLQYLSEEQVALAETAIKEITDGKPYYTQTYITSEINGEEYDGIRFYNHELKRRFHNHENKMYMWFRLSESEEVRNQLENSTDFEINYDEGYELFIDSEDQFNKHLPILKKMFKLTMGEDDGIWPDEPDTHQTLNDTANSE